MARIWLAMSEAEPLLGLLFDLKGILSGKGVQAGSHELTQHMSGAHLTSDEWCTHAPYIHSWLAYVSGHRRADLPFFVPPVLPVWWLPVDRPDSDGGLERTLCIGGKKVPPFWLLPLPRCKLVGDSPPLDRLSSKLWTDMLSPYLFRANA